MLWHSLATLWCLLLICAARGLSEDFVTYRYYGRHWARFERTRNWPNASEVCRTFMAVCVDIRLNQCVKAHPEMHAPFTRKVTHGEMNVGSEIYQRGEVQASEGEAKYMLLQDVASRHEDEKGLTLWSGCEEGCDRCRFGTGVALYPVELPAMCRVTLTGGVFGIDWNKNVAA